MTIGPLVINFVSYVVVFPPSLSNVDRILQPH